MAGHIRPSNDHEGSVEYKRNVIRVLFRGVSKSIGRGGAVKSPTRVIALEEHFWSPATRDLYGPEMVRILDRITNGLLDDVGERRIRRMDEAGIDVQVL